MAWGFDAMFPRSIAEAGTLPLWCLGWHGSGYEESGKQATGLHPQPTNHPMSLIITNTSRLSVLEKCSRGAVVIDRSTDNPLVPGNAEQLADFAQRQEALVASNAAVQEARATLASLLFGRDEAEKEWDRGIAMLASLTEALTKGDRTGMISAGFGVRGRGVPPQPLPAPEAVMARTNGTPGVTKLSWAGLDGTASYVVEMAPDPSDQADWRQMATPTKASCEVPGAEPGKPCWFRVAGVNPLGRGPWSSPTSRPVM